jgi:plastocyanin
LLVIGAGAGSAQNLTGRVVGARGSRAAQLVVFLTGGEVAAERGPPQAAEIVQRRKTFIPHVLPIAVGGTVNFLNEDSLLHNLHAYEGRRTLFNRGQPAFASAVRHTFTRSGTVLLLCDVHPEMEGYVVVAPTRWTSAVASDGTFSLSDVPPGSYTLVLWDERRRGSTAEQPVVVGPRAPTTVEVRLPAASP